MIYCIRPHLSSCYGYFIDTQNITFTAQYITVSNKITYVAILPYGGCIMGCSHDAIATTIYLLQECIPVGCVPAARRPYAGVCFGGVSAPGGVCCRGASAPRRGCLLGGCLLWGVSAPGGWHPSMH